MLEVQRPRLFELPLMILAAPFAFLAIFFGITTAIITGAFVFKFNVWK